VIGNLPYSVGTPILQRVWRSGTPRFVGMLQREVVDRLAAAPRSKSYGRLTIEGALYGTIELYRTVPSSAFHPAPEVESRIFAFQRREGPMPVRSVDRLERTVATLFSARRKQLGNLVGRLLPGGIEPDEVAAAAEWPETWRTQRPEELGPEALARREERRTLLDAVRNARGLHEKAAAEAAAQQSKLAEFIAALPPPSAGQALHTGFAALRGKMSLPTTGSIEVGFGKVVNPRFNTVTIQKGIDIRATPGEPVRSVAPGRVVHSGWFKGYGNLVIVDHGDGYYTLVAHLASMSTAMGEEVAAGSLLGTVGDTGSLKGPYLYFEIRENGRPVDPQLWLAQSP
jgi:murein DD-endopeptidase MepM/ murein hydrolase activator NlpD